MLLAACSSGSGELGDGLGGASGGSDAAPPTSPPGDATPGGEGDGAPSEAAAPDATDTLPAGGDASLRADGDAAEDAPSRPVDAGLPDSGIDAVYAAPSGTGTSCALAAPCSLFQAIATVHARAPGMTADLTVYLRGGTYRLASTLALGVEDSGQNGHRVLYRAYPGEAPLLSGAVRVSGFTSYDAAKNIWRAPIPAGAAAASGRQLFVNGVRAQRARSAGSPAGVASTATGFTTTDAAYASFKNASRIEVAMDHDWKHVRCPLASVGTGAAGGSVLTVVPSCWSANNLAVPSPDFPWCGVSNPPLALSDISWVENAYELLTTPGQFYLDQAAGFLYYAPRPGEDLGTADVELPVLESLLRLSGTPGHLAAANDDDPAATYTGSWQSFTGRPYGDFRDDAHATTASGDAVTYSFTGSGVEVLGELDPSHAPFQAYVDGVLDAQPHTENAPARLAQQVVYAVSGLPVGAHTIKLVSGAAGGTYTMVDAFVPLAAAIAPVHDIAFEGIGFEYATWSLPSTVGYVDNQAGVLWDTSGPAATAFRIPAAVQVHRGSNIAFTGDEFRHLGGTAVDLADGTQQSSVGGCTIDDISGGAVSLGEADDYFQNDPSLMTSGDEITDNAISFVALEYHDAVGVWGGYTRNAIIAHNDIGHTSYSGISLGWGWGWASTCDLQAAQGNVPACRHGSIYAGGNRIVFNYIHDVMGHLFDGGPIYTNGGQGNGNGNAGGTATSILANNFVTGGNDTNNMLYQDEGSSYWSTHDNVTSFGGSAWIGMWTPTIHDITVGPVNYTDNASTLNNGTSIAYTAPSLVSGGAWPAAALAIEAAAGLEPAYRSTKSMLDDDDQAIAYTGSWATSGFRGFGDYDDNVHYTTTDGDAVTVSFGGTQIAFVGERDASQGPIEWFVDGGSQGTVQTSVAAGAPRQVQQTLFVSATLAAGPHALKVVKRGGQYMAIDAFRVQP